MTFTPGKVLTAAELNAALANYVPIASLASTASGQGGSRVGLSIGDTVEEFVAKLMSHNGSDIIGTPEGTVQEALEAQSAAIIKASTGRVALERFGIKPDGTEKSAQISDALVAAKSGGATTVEFAASPLGYGVDVGNSIWVPDGLTISGPDGGALIKGLGTAFRTDGALVYVRNPATGARYGAETGWRTIGNGATFNVTVSGGKVTSVAVANPGGIANGGTVDYVQGDRLLLGTGTGGQGTGTIIFVDVTGGAITGIAAIESGGSGWSGSASGISQTNTTGGNRADRIVDPASFAERVVIRNLTVDCGYGYGNARLTGTQRLHAIAAYGVKDLEITGCRGLRTPNNAIMAFDCQNMLIERNRARDNGWSGIFGGPRNGISATGLYLLAYPQLNTTRTRIAYNLCEDIGDVGIQTALTDGVEIVGNQVFGCTTLGLEGESHAYAVRQLRGVNTSYPPGNVLIADNLVDGRMFPGRRGTDTATASAINEVAPYGFLGITYEAGNQGTIIERGNTIRNLNGPALKLFQLRGGKIRSGRGTLIENTNMGADAAIPPSIGYSGASEASGASGSESYFRVQLQGADIEFKGATVSGAPKREAVYIKDNQDTTRIVVTDNTINGTTDASDTSSAALRVNYAFAHSGGILDLSRNIISSSQAALVQVDVAGVEVTLDDMAGIDLTLIDANRANQVSASAFKTLTTGGGKFTPKAIRLDGMRYLETSVSSNTTTPVLLTHTALTSGVVTINDMIAPQFATKYSLTGMAVQPSFFSARDPLTPAFLSHPGYVAGNWYLQPGMRGALTAGLVGGTAKWWPVSVGKAITITDLAIKVTTAGAAGSNAQLAIYAENQNSHQPAGSALATTGNLSTASAAVVSAALGSPFTLQPGVQYWMALVVSDSATQVAQCGASSPGGSSEALGDPTLANLVSGTANMGLLRSRGAAVGTWPYLNDGDTTTGIGGIPVVWMKAG